MNSENGLLVECGNQNQLQEAMHKMLINFQKYDREVLRGEANTRFGEDIFVENAVVIYKKVIEDDSNS